LERILVPVKIAVGEKHRGGETGESLNCGGGDSERIERLQKRLGGTPDPLSGWAIPGGEKRGKIKKKKPQRPKREGGRNICLRGHPSGGDLRQRMGGGGEIVHEAGDM